MFYLHSVYLLYFSPVHAAPYFCLSGTHSALCAVLYVQCCACCVSELCGAYTCGLLTPLPLCVCLRHARTYKHPLPHIQTQNFVYASAHARNTSTHIIDIRRVHFPRTRCECSLLHSHARIDARTHARTRALPLSISRLLSSLALQVSRSPAERRSGARLHVLSTPRISPIHPPLCRPRPATAAARPSRAGCFPSLPGRLTRTLRGALSFCGVLCAVRATPLSPRARTLAGLRGWRLARARARSQRRRAAARAVQEPVAPALPARCCTGWVRHPPLEARAGALCAPSLHGPPPHRAASPRRYPPHRVPHTLTLFMLARWPPLLGRFLPPSAQGLCRPLAPQALFSSLCLFPPPDW